MKRLTYTLGRSQADRKVTWVWDETGNIGKSFLADWFEIWRGAFLVTGGKFGDISHSFECQTYVVFDFSRAQEDKFPYRLLEEHKNLKVYSPKYESRRKRAVACKLVVFCNFAPDRSKLSADRWDVHHINPLPLQMI